MKALTVWQPWGQLIVWGKKHIETRDWKTDYRGPFPEPIPTKGQQRLWNYEEELDHAGILQQYYRDIAKES